MFEQCELMLSELVTVLGYIGISDFARVSSINSMISGEFPDKETSTALVY